MSDELNDHWHETDRKIKAEMAFPLLLAAIAFGLAFLILVVMEALGAA